MSQEQSTNEPPVAVVGGGRFGWGLADTAARHGRRVILWSRRPQRPATEAIHVTQELGELAAAELIFVAVPSAFVGEVAGRLGEHLDGAHLLVHVSRGLVGDELRPLSAILREVTPCRRIGALGGPVVADALSRGEPGGGIVGTRFPEVRDAVRGALGRSTLRIYSTDDVMGVEVAMTLVGLLSVAVGFARAMGVGPATLAVMGTRGMAEAARIGASFGGRIETFGGLAGFGDLMAAIAGDTRPELGVGARLAGGMSPAEAAREAGAHIEGLAVARRIADHVERAGVQAPLTGLLATLFEGKISAEGMIKALMARRVGEE
ncbi:MAG: NAD(P)-binding domain-containing protein [Myxococcales bacterium]|nr:NAD(P)-binding domain-containing protein [Myxococcales bacterium]